MPARPTPPRTIALITALGVIPPALIIYLDARYPVAVDTVGAGDAGAADSSATKAATSDTGTIDLDDTPEAPSWDEPFTDLQAELARRCDTSPATSSVRDIIAAEEQDRACTARELGAALPGALSALPAERRAALAEAFRALDGDVDRLCVVGDERSWSNHARGLRYDGDERLIQFYLPCLSHARHGLIFLLRAIAKGDLDTFTAHLESAQPIGQRTSDSIADMKARVDTAWDRGLRTGYLRLRVGSGGQGVLGPRAWANLTSMSERVETSATRFGEAVCQAWPALASARDPDCKEQLALYFHALVSVDPPTAARGEDDAEEDLLGPSLSGQRRTHFGYLPPALRERISWKPVMGEPLEAATLTPVVALLKGEVELAFHAKIEADPAHAAARIREQAQWSRHVSKLCWLDEELFWRGPLIRYHGKGEGVIGALCQARAHALRLVELGAGAVPFATAITDMEADATVVLERFPTWPLPAPRPPRVPRHVDETHGAPLTLADERAIEGARASLLTSAASLASATCAAWAKEDRPPLADCQNRLRAYYLAYGSFSSVAVERDE